MSRGGATYGFLLVGVTLALALLVFWLIEPAAMPALLREHVCVAR